MDALFRVVTIGGQPSHASYSDWRERASPASTSPEGVNRQADEDLLIFQCGVAHQLAGQAN